MVCKQLQTSLWEVTYACFSDLMKFMCGNEGCSLEGVFNKISTNTPKSAFREGPGGKVYISQNRPMYANRKPVKVHTWSSPEGKEGTLIYFEGDQQDNTTLDCSSFVFCQMN